ncbi:MAG TPA: carboxypeptidase regulatory-like domain-containing protein [Kofleriaceae bacterium]|nr:carboxypeptidase regulatory-like domain-containing protein [Kofleriaceae bacterium]
MRKPIVILIILLGLISRARAQGLTTGAVQGIITDANTGEPLIGVTVVASSPALQGQQSAITDETGEFKITNLPAGTYTITYYYVDLVVRRTVDVSINKTTPAYAKLDVAQASSEVVEIEGRAPAIDPSSTSQGVTLDKDFVKNLPVGRSYAENLSAAAGTHEDDAGMSFSGSSSLENTYVVDGVNTTSLRYGQVGTPVINEFIQQTEIITGGYGAEFGRSTGAVVNVVTKSGSNEFHGSIFGYASPGALIARAQATPTESGSIDSEVNEDLDTDFGFELGGPVIKDKIWFYAGVAPHVDRSTMERITKRRVDRDGDGQPDVDPSTGFLVFEELDRQALHLKTDSVPFVGKLSFAAAPEHQGFVSIIGTPETGNDLSVDGLPSATHLFDTKLTTDVSAKWTSKLDDNKTEIEGVFGWHRGTDRQTPIDAFAANLPRQNLYYGDLATWGMLGGESASTIAGCSDGGNDPYPMIRNCPDEGTGYAIGGPGQLIDFNETRLSGRVSITQRLTGLGHHEVKAGLDAEDNELLTRRANTGDMYFDVMLPNGDDPGKTYEWRFVQLAPDGNPQGLPDSCPDTDEGTTRACKFLGATNVVGDTFNWAAYLRDSWQVIPGFTINAGLRYEEQRMRYAKDLQNTVDPFTGVGRGTNAMELRGMWAPRVGAIYDWTGEGRAKIYGHWGRFFESVPMDLNTVNFGGETTYRRVYEMDQCGSPTAGVGGPDGPSCVNGGQPPMFGSNVFGSGVLVAPGVKAQYMDEAIAGIEYAVTDDFKIGAAYSDRRLGRVLEDISPDNTVTYVLSNPGEFDEDAERSLEAQIANTADADEKARLQGQLDVFRGIRKFDKPKRVYQSIQLTAVKRFSRALFLQATYTYARTQGNFPGLYSPESGAINPNITAQYDLIELLANRNGPLPNDRPHEVKLDTYYMFDFDKAGTLTTGARARASSGTPVDVLGANSLYGFDESFLLPRGAMGRTTYDAGLDLHLGYGRKLGKDSELEVFADLFNVFDRQSPDTLDQTYTHDNVNPIVGGDGSDLIWAKTQDGDGNEPAEPGLPTRNLDFRNAKTRNAPFMARLGARLTF